MFRRESLRGYKYVNGASGFTHTSGGGDNLISTFNDRISDLFAEYH